MESLLKVLEKFTDRRLKPGDTVTLIPDKVVVSDIICKGAFETVSKIFDPSRVEVVIEHGLPSVIEVSDHHRDMVRFASEHNIELNHGVSISYFELVNKKADGEKIQVVVSAGDRNPMLGMAGIIGVKVTPMQMKQVLETGTVEYVIPDTVRVKMTGTLPKGVTLRDAAYYFAAENENRFQGKCIELVGSIENFTMNEKMEFANYLSEAGAQTAWIGSDSDDVQETLNLSMVQPMLVLPGSMRNGIPLADFEQEIPFRVGFIGGCGGGTIESLRCAAGILKDRQVAYAMRLVVSPVDTDTYLRAAREGLIKIFMDAGAVFMNPGCLSCTGVACGRMGKNEIALSTGSFNTPGCCGADSSQIYLASAETVARGCISGIISARLGDRTWGK